MVVDMESPVVGMMLDILVILAVLYVTSLYFRSVSPTMRRCLVVRSRLS